MNCKNLLLRYSLLYRFAKLIKKDNIQSFNFKKKPLSEFKEILVKGIDSCQNSIIKKIFSDLSPYKQSIDIYLHGSWADNTKTPFSDLDDFILLDIKKINKNQELEKICTILNKIDMKFCRIDPLQHHGHWIVNKEDLMNYDNSFMPLHILKESKVVLGNSLVSGKINIKLSDEGLIKNIINTCSSIRKLSNKFFENSINSYELKGLVGSFALMPAFIMQKKGLDYTKPEAINKAQSVFSNNALSCIEWSTNNRRNWAVITENLKFKIFGLLTYLFLDPHLWRRFSGKFSPQIKPHQIKALSCVPLNKESVDLFISESLTYAK